MCNALGARIELRLGCQNEWELPRCPFGEDAKRFRHAFSNFGNGVLDTRGSCFNDTSRDHAIAFQAPQALGECFLGDAAHPSLELIKAKRLVTKREEDRESPLIGQLIQKNATGVDIGRNNLLKHTAVPLRILRSRVNRFWITHQAIL